jgi:ferrochelatase
MRAESETLPNFARHDYDALLIVSFGGPEGSDDVLPFLENVLRGRNVPRERMLEVAEHYRHFGGVSPLNAQNRALIAALRGDLETRGPRLPIYWGNRNWHPFLKDTLAQMRADGIRRALAFCTSAYSSYSSCRQYLENIRDAQLAVGEGAPQVDKLRAFFNHPGFIEAMAQRTRAALQQIPDDRRAKAQLVYTAHSIPISMANACQYVAQLKEASRLVSVALGRGEATLAYQSRSGPATQPWLEPDIGDYLRKLANTASTRDAVIVPIGFLSDHLEVLYDLDVEAATLSCELGLNMVRAATVGTHPAFVEMIRDLILERTVPGTQRKSLGGMEASHDECPADCCPGPPTRAAASTCRAV